MMSNVYFVILSFRLFNDLFYGVAAFSVSGSYF